MFTLPKLNNHQRNAYAYLTIERKIDKKIIEYLLKQHYLFQDIHNNCVWPWYDGEKNIVGADLVGTHCKYRFKNVVSGSNAKISFNMVIKGVIKNVKYFESVIDLLSYIELNKREIMNTLFVSMAGLKKEPIQYYMEKYPDAQHFLCVDNEMGNKKFIEYMLSNYPIMRLELPCGGKDWNELLRQIKR